MQEHERSRADREEPPFFEPPEAGGQVWVLDHPRQDPFNDRLRRRAAVLVFMTVSMAASAPKFFSGGSGPTIIWSGAILVPALLLAATLLTMRRRAKAGPRGIRRLDPVSPGRGLEASATEG